MARKLPWEKSSPKTEAPTPSPSVVASPSPRIPVAPRANAGPHQSTLSRARVRSPSTSPPPEPPAQQFMVPTDDKYRMVEDELLRIAQQFTTHLHRAEYARLKEMTRSRNARTIREIERPVIPGRAATLAARWRREVGARDEKHRGQGWGVSPPLVRTSLQGLMMMEKGDDDDDGDGVGDGARIGIGFGSRARGRGTGGDARTRTRAAAACSSREKTSGPRRLGGEEESSAGCEAETETETQTETQTETETVDGPWSMGERRVAGYGGDVEDHERGHDDDDDDDDDGDDDPFGVNRRRVRRIQSREQMRVDKGKGKEGVMRAPDTIPSFL